MYQRGGLKYFVMGIVAFLTLGYSSYYVLTHKETLFSKNSEKATIFLSQDMDSDADGLSDLEEEKAGTDPYNIDTDGDGFPDSVEVRSGFNPLLVEKKNKYDADEDGLNDSEEARFGTNPHIADSDFDGEEDGREIIAGTNPLKTDLAYFLQIAESKAKTEEIKETVEKTNEELVKEYGEEDLEKLFQEQAFSSETNNENDVKRNELGDYLYGLSTGLGAANYSGIDLSGSSVKSLESTLSSSTLDSFQNNFSEFAKSSDLNVSSLGTQVKVDLPEVASSDLKIKENYTREDIEKYFTILVLTMSKELPFSDPDSFEKYALSIRLQDKSDMREVNEIFSKVERELRNIEVPNEERILNLHKKNLAFVMVSKSIIGEIERVDFNESESLYKLTELMPKVNYLTNTVFFGEIFPEIEKILSEYNLSSIFENLGITR